MSPSADLTLTAKQLAEKIVPPGGDLQPFVERIHHWTRENLLTPKGEKNPGRGRVRHYGEEAIVSAKILNALADFGIGIGIMGPAIAQTALTLGEHAAAQLEGYRERGITAYLCVHKGVALGPHPVVTLQEQQDLILIQPSGKVPLQVGPPMHPAADAMLVINLSKLLT
jgi:hypothetical protein